MHYESYGDYRFIEQNGKTWILNAELRPVAEIDASSDAFLVGTSLHERKDNSIIAVDLSSILDPVPAVHAKIQMP